jgi:formylglycine-generating enzyme required for sulfatase activity
VRLPTEAEWEYACRADEPGRFCTGNDTGAVAEFCWYGDNAGGGPQAVGTKRANAWGLADMHGNVWEWCRDRYDSRYYARSPASDPTGPADGKWRSLRGGSWNNPVLDCRSAVRCGFPPDYAADTIGFRVAMDVPAKR